MSQLSFHHCTDMPAAERAEAYDLLVADPEFTANLVSAIANDPACQEVGTWFIKHHLEQGNTLPAKQAIKLYTLSETITAWQALLHLLQCLPILTLHKGLLQPAETLIRRGLEHDNKFVRAWSYNGFHLLALANDRYEAEAEQLLAAALLDEAPSVRARLRNLGQGKKGK